MSKAEAGYLMAKTNVRCPKRETKYPKSETNSECLD